MKTKKINQEESMDISIFQVGKILCGINIQKIQEINKHVDITPVTNSPEYIRGMMNLRGNIITIIDMRAKFGMEVKKEIDEDMRILVVSDEDEHIGLLVDKMLDVVKAEESLIEPPPSNIQGVAGRYFANIFKMEGKLVAILDVEEVLKVQERR